MSLAITRAVSPDMAQCQLTHLPRVPVDLERARAQHRNYQAALLQLGCEVIELPAAPAAPDSVFIEDTALVLDEVAVLCRPGAEARRGEVPAVAEVMRPLRRLGSIDAPGTVDGGDLLVAGRQVFAGLTTRSNSAGLAQLAELLAPFGYTVTPVPVAACLHLKSAVTCLSEEFLLVNPAWIDRSVFAGFGLIEICPDESHAANVLRTAGGLIYPNCFPRTQERLAAAGFEVLTVDVSELQKAEGAVTCCSLLVA